MRVARLIACLVIGVVFPGQLTSLFGQGVATLIHDVSDMADGSVTQARIEAQRQAASGDLAYRSYTKGDPSSFSGKYTPPELPDDKKGRFVYGLALFSDDGCSVTVNGSLIHQRMGQGQHLPSIGDSFHVLQTALAPGEPIDITVDYSNIIYDDDPHSPGYPDIDGCTLFLYLLPAGIAVDANRDGTIAFSEEARDITSQDTPFRFWINDDNDGLPNSEGDVINPSFPDYEDGVIQTARDLEDFATLHLFIDAFQKELTEGTFRIGLKFKDVGGTTPRINIYRSTDNEGSDSYLKDEQAALSQVSGRDAGALGEVTDGNPMMVPQDFWRGNNAQDSKKCLLFEAGAEGKGQLIMTVNKFDGTQIAEIPGVWLDLKNIKKMYYRGKAQPENIAAPNGNVVGPFTGPVSWVPDPNEQPFPTEKPKGENDQAVIFLHGWSMDYNDYISFSETMMKRLWHAGFKGRFCSLRWDPLVVTEIFGQPASNGEYNRSEQRAWLYGESLKQFAQSIKNQGFRVSLIGHSMGNIVCGSALQKGFQAQNYLLMEAAVPAGCFDSGSGVNNYARFLNAEQSEPTPDYHEAPNGDLTKGYRGFMSSISANVANSVVNFRNRLDYALATGFKYGIEANWERNQIDYKPDGNVSTDWHYHYYPNRTNLNERATQEFTFFVGRFVTDSHEMKSFVARPRSKAVGALEGTSAAPNGVIDVNLEATYHFDSRDSDHSGQFKRRIQEVDDLYLTVVSIVQPPPQQ